MKNRTKKRLIALGLVLAVGAGGAVALRQMQKSRRAQSVERSREVGMAAYEAGDWQGALDNLGSYLNRSRRADALALYRLADARLRIPEDDRSHVTQALRSAIDAAAADPSHVPTRDLLLDLYRRDGRFSEALGVLDRALQVTPDDRALLEARVQVLMALDRWPQAREASLALVRADPDNSDSHLTHLMVIASEARPTAGQEMVAYLDQAGEAMGPGPDLETLRAIILFDAGRIEDSLAACEAAVAASPSQGREVGLLLDTLDLLSGLEDTRAKAMELTQRLESQALALQPIPEDVGIALVARWFRLGLDPRVEQALPGVVASPGDASDRALGWAAIAGDPRTPATQAARAALASRTGEEGSFWNALLRAAQGLRDGDLSAIEAARESVGLRDNLDPRQVDERLLAQYIQAGAEQARGATTLAEEGFAAVANGTRWRIARTSYLALLLERGAEAQALGALNESYANDPGFQVTAPGLLFRAAALVGLAERAPDSGADIATAVEILELVSGDRNAVGGRFLGLLARARAISGDAPGAAQAVDQMLALGDALDVNQAVTTGSALRASAPAQSARLLDEARRRDPDNTSLLFSEAIAALAQNQGDAALASLEASIARTQGPDRLALRVLRARILDAAGKPEALPALTALAQEFPDDVAVQRAVIDSDSAWTDEPTVRAAIARLRALSGDDSPAWRLAEARRLLTFGEPGTNQQRASEALTVALEPLLRASSQNARALALAADAWLALGRRDQAIVHLERAVSAPGSTPQNHQRLISLLLQDGRANDARDRMRGYLALGDLGVAASRSRALLLAQLEMWDEAVAERQRLAALGDASDRLALGVLLTSAGRFDEAHDAIDPLLETTPPDLDALVAGARLLRLEGDLPGAIALLDRLKGAIPESQRLLRVADLLISAGEPERARALVESFAADPASDTDDPELWLWIARTAYERGDAAAGNAAVTRGLESSPDYAPLLAMRRLQDQGVTDPQLLSALASVQSPDGQDAAGREFADALLQVSRGQLTPEAYEARVEAITTEHPLYFSAWRVLRLLRLQRGDEDAAARTARAAMDAIPADHRPAREAADLLAFLGRYPEALEAARVWRDRTPSDPMEADLYIAELLLQMGRPADAAAVAAPWKALILGSTTPEPREAGVLARVIAAGGLPADRASLLEKAGANPVWAAACINAAGDIAEPAPRRAWLERLTALDDLTDEHVLDLAIAWHAMGETVGGPEDFEASLDLLGARALSGTLALRAGVLRGMALRRTGQIDQAVRAYTDTIAAAQAANEPEAADALRDARGGLVLLAVEDDPTKAAQAVPVARALWEGVRQDRSVMPAQRAATGDLIARLYLAAGEVPAAAAVLDEVTRLAPRDPAIIARRVYIHMLSDDRTSAQAIIDSIPTRDAQVRLMLAVAADFDALPGSPRAADAEWLLRRAYAVDRNNFLVTNNLAYHLVSHNGDASEAATLAQESVSSVLGRGAAPEVLASVYETLGVALLQARRPEEAERAFVSGLRSQNNSPALRVGLAAALEAQGRRAEAKEVLDSIGVEARDALDASQRARYDRLATALEG